MMSIDEKKAFRFLFVALGILLVAVAANALIDLGAVIHDLTHSH
jgi:hypothetical protein